MRRNAFYPALYILPKITESEAESLSLLILLLLLLVCLVYAPILVFGVHCNGIRSYKSAKILSRILMQLQVEQQNENPLKSR